MEENKENIFIKSYWNYYLELEDQFIATKKFVEFDVSNSTTYSVEYLKLFQAVCSEIDVVAKVLAEEYDPSFKKIDNKNIQKWGYYLQSAYPHLETTSVTFNNDYSVYPWQNWKYESYTDKNGAFRYRLVRGKETPFWWTAYNKVKHERTSHFKDGKANYSRANQKNLIYAMAALFVLEMAYLESFIKETRTTYSDSRLFKYNR